MSSLSLTQTHTLSQRNSFNGKPVPFLKQPFSPQVDLSPRSAAANERSQSQGWKTSKRLHLLGWEHSFIQWSILMNQIYWKKIITHSRLLSIASGTMNIFLVPILSSLSLVQLRWDIVKVFYAHFFPQCAEAKQVLEWPFLQKEGAGTEPGILRPRVDSASHLTTSLCNTVNTKALSFGVFLK